MFEVYILTSREPGNTVNFKYEHFFYSQPAAYFALEEIKKYQDRTNNHEKEFYIDIRYAEDPYIFDPSEYVD